MATAARRGGQGRAVGQHEWDPILGVFGAPPMLVYVSGDWDVHWKYRVLKHRHIYIYLFICLFIFTE